MIQLRCTVRNCQQPLARHESVLRCDSGHSFDQAKEGYWNLTQPQDKKSSNPGDSDDAVLARHRWLKRGHASGLVESLKAFAFAAVQDGPILDIGCGEGSFGPALFSDHASSFCGIDLSRRAIKLAARGWPEATWVLANADRGLPLADASMNTVISLFGRRPVSEIGRVMKGNGICVVAIPGEEDLIELREQVQQSGHRRSRWESVAEEMKSAGLELAQHELWTQQIDLDAEEISDALAMTYRAARRSQQLRLEGIERMQVTLAADLLLFRRGQ